MNFLLSRVAEASNGRENRKRTILVGGGKWKGGWVQSRERLQSGSEAGAPQGPGREAWFGNAIEGRGCQTEKKQR